MNLSFPNRRQIFRQKISCFVFLCVLLLSYAFPRTYAQQYAMADAKVHSGKPTQGDQQKSLEEVLHSLEQEHQINFMYDLNLVEEKFVDPEKSGNDSFEQYLKNILNSVQLEYSKINDNYYVIKPKSPAEKDIQVIESNHPIEMNKGGNSYENVLGKPDIKNWAKLAMIDKTISGIVTDATDNSPLPGVNVLVKGTSSGTITDVNGAYRLTVPDDAQTLVFSFVGYHSEEVAINNQNSINVQLTPDIQSLEEVVVVGYGTRKKRDVIGSVASVSGEELKQVPLPSFDAALQGMAAGVQVQNTSGVPGAPTRVLIRGTNSISSGTNPLYIVDGMPIYSSPNGLAASTDAANQSPLSTINPNDIASIEVLKDAAATSIYGSRGSNGVILITTKSGKKDQSKTEISYSTGISGLSKTPEDMGFATSAQYFDLMDQARANSGLSPFETSMVTNLFIDDPITEISRQEAERTNTDWYDALLRTGSYQDVNVSTSSGFDNGSYYISANYRDDKGVTTNNRLQRYSLRANLDFNPVENLYVGARLSFAYTKNHRVPGKDGGSGAGFGAIGLRTLPWWKIYNPDHTSGYWNPMSGNLIANIDEDLRLDEVDQYRGLGGIFLEYSLPWVEGLAIRGEISADIIQNNSVFWLSEVLREDGSYAKDQAITSNNYNYNIYATFDRTFNMHHIQAVAGTESQDINRYRRTSTGQNLVGKYQQLGSPVDRLSMFAGLDGERYLRAYFGRFNYKFKDRYLFGVSIRRDGSSAFTEENRWGTFTAISGGWILSDETFFNAPFVSLLKLRGSFGQTGNQDIPSNLDVTQYRTNWRYGTDDVASGGTALLSIGNSDLTWETTDSYDIGVDFGLFEDKISGSIAYFVQDVDDLLLEVPIPVSTGLTGSSSIWANAGELSNKGFEFSLNTVNIHTTNFKWSTQFNFTTNSSKVKSLSEDVDATGQGIISDITITRTGGRLGAFFLAEYAGIDPERGIELIYEIDRDLYLETGETVKTGRKIPATLANVRDHRVIHEDVSGLPTYFGGFTNKFEYKGFDLNVFFTFMGGNHIYDYALSRTSYAQRGQRWLRSDLIGNTWTTNNPNAKYPELRWDSGYNYTWDEEAGEIVEGVGNYNSETFFHDRFMQKGDFIRLRNLQLGYNLPPSVLDKINMQHLRLYVAGTNLLTFTNFEGWDPEVVSTGGSAQEVNLAQGRLNVPELPQLRTFSIGINASF